MNKNNKLPFNLIIVFNLQCRGRKKSEARESWLLKLLFHLQILSKIPGKFIAERHQCEAKKTKANRNLHPNKEHNGQSINKKRGYDDTLQNDELLKASNALTHTGMPDMHCVESYDQDHAGYAPSRSKTCFAINSNMMSLIWNHSINYSTDPIFWNPGTSGSN